MLEVKSIYSGYFIGVFPYIFNVSHLSLNSWIAWCQVYYYFKRFKYAIYGAFSIFAGNTVWWVNFSASRHLVNKATFKKRKRIWRVKKFRDKIYGSYRRLKRRYLALFDITDQYLRLDYRLDRPEDLEEYLLLKITASLFYLSRIFSTGKKHRTLKNFTAYSEGIFNLPVSFVSISSSEYYANRRSKFFFKVFLLRRIYFSRIIAKHKYQYNYRNFNGNYTERAVLRFFRSRFRRFVNRLKRLRRRYYYYFKARRSRRLRFKSRGHLITSRGGHLRLRVFSIFYTLLQESDFTQLIAIFLKSKQENFINRFYHTRRRRLCTHYGTKEFRAKYWSWRVEKFNNFILSLNLGLGSPRGSSATKRVVNPLKFSYLQFSCYPRALNEELSLRQRSFIFEKTLTTTFHYFFYKRYKYNLQFKNKSLFAALPHWGRAVQSGYVSRTPVLNLDRAILEKLRLARQAEWIFRKPVKLNRRRYLVYFRHSLQHRPAFFYQTIFIYFITQLFGRFLSWYQVQLLLALKFFRINGDVPVKFTPEYGDIIEFPTGLALNLISLWSQRHTRKFVMRIRRWAYLKYCAHVSRKFSHKKNPPKYVRKLPIAYIRPGRSFIFDYSINVSVYTFRVGTLTDDGMSKLFDTTVYKLYPWKFRA